MDIEWNSASSPEDEAPSLHQWQSQNENLSDELFDNEHMALQKAQVVATYKSLNFQKVLKPSTKKDWNCLRCLKIFFILLREKVRSLE